jgi:diguanylate cyclase (GGDEF)-like protein
MPDNAPHPPEPVGADPHVRPGDGDPARRYLAAQVDSASVEELREQVLSQHQQLRGLRRDVANLSLLIEALNTLMERDADAEPFTAVFGVLGPLFQFSQAAVLVEDDAGGTLRCVVSTEPGLVDTLWQATSMTTRVLAGRVIATVTQHRESSWPSAATQLGLRPQQPALYLPVSVRDQRGLMMLLRPVGAEGFDRRDIAVARKLSLIASQALATRRANRVERERTDLKRLAGELQAARDSLAYRANHDELTGLVSRSYFEHQATTAIAGMKPGQQLAIAFIDLDGFKQVNDYYGHEIGDDLLIEVANRLRRYLVDDTDLVARISGDEFLFLSNPITSADDVMKAATRGLADLREPFLLRGRQLMISASVGVAIYPDHGTTFDELRRNADMAMYRAKHSTRGVAMLYQPSMGLAVATKLDKEQRLRRAVAERRFKAAVQPKVDVKTMEIVGFELLARQVDENGTVGTSASFIDLAVQSGLLDEITTIVLDDALALLPQIDQQFGAHTTFSVNVSTRQATDPVLLRSFLDRISASGYASRFTMEVTEDALLAIDVFRDEILPVITAAGVGVSIDDFGTGYASMSRLLTITANEIKIDRSFVTGLPTRPRSQVMLKAMETIGNELGAVVVAEGIETIEELDYLRQHTNVHVAQGYLFARPMLPAELIAQQAELMSRLSRAHAAAAGPVDLPSSP